MRELRGITSGVEGSGVRRARCVAAQLQPQCANPPCGRIGQYDMVERPLNVYGWNLVYRTPRSRSSFISSNLSRNRRKFPLRSRSEDREISPEKIDESIHEVNNPANLEFVPRTLRVKPETPRSRIWQNGKLGRPFESFDPEMILPPNDSRFSERLSRTRERHSTIGCASHPTRIIVNERAKSWREHSCRGFPREEVDDWLTSEATRNVPHSL